MSNCIIFPQYIQTEGTHLLIPSAHTSNVLVPVCTTTCHRQALPHTILMNEKSARKKQTICPINKYQFISLTTAARFPIQKNSNNKTAAIQFDIIDIDIEPENARRL